MRVLAQNCMLLKKIIKFKAKKSGFTLLEVIIVIIIVGVLASVAMPRMASIVQLSKSVEAIQAIIAIRNSVEQCAHNLAAFDSNVNYNQCNEFRELNIDNPATAPGAIFSYRIRTFGLANLKFTIRASRTDAAAGGCGFRPADHWIEYSYLTDGRVLKSGNGYYANLH